MKGLRKKTTGTKRSTQQIQKQDTNSDTSDTLSNLIESTKEDKVDIQKEIPIGMQPELIQIYEEKDIVNTYRDLKGLGITEPSFRMLKLSLNSRVQQGKIKRRIRPE